MEDGEISYEDQVVEAAIQGLVRGGTIAPQSFDKLFRLIYRAGYDEAVRNQKGFSGTMD